MFKVISHVVLFDLHGGIPPLSLPNLDQPEKVSLPAAGIWLKTIPTEFFGQYGQGQSVARSRSGCWNPFSAIASSSLQASTTMLTGASYAQWQMPPFSSVLQMGEKPDIITAADVLYDVTQVWRHQCTALALVNVRSRIHMPNQYCSQQNVYCYALFHALHFCATCYGHFSCCLVSEGCLLKG
jgi:hypothetical protein